VLISPGKQVPRREFSGITGSPSHPRGDIPEWQNFPAAVWNVFPRGEEGLTTNSLPADFNYPREI